MDVTKIMTDLATNLAYNFTWLANPAKDGVIFKYDPEAPILDKTGKPTGKTFRKLTTTIIFEDGTKCTCSNSQLDKINAVLVSEHNGVKLPEPVITADETAKELGIINCLYKRMIGTINADGTINGSGGAKWLKDQISKNSYDQSVMEIYGKAVKKLEAEKNEAAHKAAAKKAHDHKVKRLARQIQLEREAEELLAAKKITKTASAKPLCETKITIKPAVKTAPGTKRTASGFPKKHLTVEDFFSDSCKDDETYVRPNKRFSEFTPEEKREYWRAQKRGWL